MGGLATVPMLDGICAMREAPGTPKLRLLMGLDANAYGEGKKGKNLSAAEFREACTSRGLGECWSGCAAETPHLCSTTYNARTYLQPQLNKAVSRSSALTSPHTDRNPKDHIIFDKTQYEPHSPPERDNQGKRGVF